MTWDLAAGPIAADQIDALSPPEPLDDEQAEQLDAAKQTAAALIASGAVGDPAGEYLVHLHGHANPGHEPRDGWAHDIVHVSVGQA